MVQARRFAAQTVIGAALFVACAEPATEPPRARRAHPAEARAAERAQEVRPASVIRVEPPPEPKSEFILAGDAQGDEPVVSSVPIPGTALVRGLATVRVRSPIERVRSVILGFARYPEFLPHYRACRVLGRTASGGSDVYMEVAALHGAVKLWTRVDVSKPSVAEGVETYEARFVEGNVRDFKGIWRLKKIDDAQTDLAVEVFMHPRLPVPDSILNKENIDGARGAVLAFKARSERSP